MPCLEYFRVIYKQRKPSLSVSNQNADYPSNPAGPDQVSCLFNHWLAGITMCQRKYHSCFFRCFFYFKRFRKRNCHGFVRDNMKSSLKKCFCHITVRSIWSCNNNKINPCPFGKTVFFFYHLHVMTVYSAFFNS